MHHLLIYDLAPDYLERRPTFRSEHLTMAWEAHGRGELVLGGALTDPTDRAVLLFTGDTPEVIRGGRRATPVPGPTPVGASRPPGY